MRRLLVVLAAGALVLAVGATAAGAGGNKAARRSAPQVGAPKGDLRIVAMNILHGITCPNAPDDCQGDDRMALLGQQLQAARCPQVVALEEIAQRTYERVVAAPWVKECKYKVVWHDMPSVDRELVLTTLPVSNQRLTVLAGNFRSAYRVELRSKLGPLVLVVTHQDGDSQPGADPALVHARGVSTSVPSGREPTDVPDDPGRRAGVGRRRSEGDPRPHRRLQRALDVGALPIAGRRRLDRLAPGREEPGM